MDKISREEFENHCKENKMTAEKLEKLMWLAEPELKEMFRKIIEAEQGRSWLSKKIADIIGISVKLLAIVGSAIGIYYFIDYLRNK